jgi:hypothetical protein
MTIDEKLQLFEKRNQALWNFDIKTLNELDVKFQLHVSSKGMDVSQPIRAIEHDREDVFMWIVDHSTNTEQWIRDDDIYMSGLSSNRLWLIKFLQSKNLIKNRTHIPLFQSISLLQGINSLGHSMGYNNSQSKQELIDCLEYLFSLPDFKDESLVAFSSEDEKTLGSSIGHNLMSYALSTNAYYLYDVLWKHTFEKGDAFIYDIPNLAESLVFLYLNSHDSFFKGEDLEVSTHYWKKLEEQHPDYAEGVIAMAKDFKYITIDKIEFIKDNFYEDYDVEKFSKL